MLHFYELFKNYRKVKTPIKGKIYNLAIADTPAKKKIGLSRLKKLPRGCGMLFVYQEPVSHAFTMKDTSIPLTIIFLDKNFQVIQAFSCRPFQSKAVKPDVSYSYVIEI